MEETLKVKFTRDDTKIVKAIAVTLMCIHHLFPFPDRIAEGITYTSLFSVFGKPVEVYIGEFGKICVALFTFLGGYGTYLSCAKKDNASLTKNLWNKLKQLYFVYWQVFVIFVPICMIRKVSRVPWGLEQLVWNFTGLRTSYNGEWWFFTPYVLLIMAFPALLTVSSRFKNVFSELIAIIGANTFIVFVLPQIAGGGIIWSSTLNQSFAYQLFSTMMSLLPAFWMGCLCAKYDLLSSIKDRYASNILGCVGALLIAALVIYMRGRIGARYDFLFAPILTVSIVTVLNSRVSKPVRFVLLKIGEESTYIWLVHSIYCYHLCQKLVFAPKNSLLIVMWLLLLCFITAKMIRFLFHNLTILWNYVYEMTVFKNNP